MSIKFYWNIAIPVCLHMVLASFILHVELNNCDSEHMSHKAKNIYYLPLTEKGC